MAEQQHENDMKLEVELLKRDISVFDKYFQKIDTTLEKLGEATAQITRMIALHEERLEKSQEDTAEIKQLIEQRRVETHSSLEGLDKKIDEQAGRLTETEQRITQSIQELKTEVLSQIGKTNDKVDARIKRLEIWRYLIIGGAMVVMFFATEFTKSYFDKYWFEQQTKIQQTINQTTPSISNPLR